MTLQQALALGNEVIERINSFIDDYTVKDDTRAMMMAGLLSLAREHYGSMLYLLDKGYYGSASALARPLYEAQIRLTWLSLCCTDEVAQKLNNGTKQFDGITDLSKKIDRALQANTFYDVLKKNEDALHDYTHGGMRQIARRFNSEGYIEASFHDDELVDLIKVSGMTLSMACMGFFAGVNDEEKASKAKEFVLNFPDFS